MSIGGASNHHGLADETTEQRECGDGKPAYHIKDQGDRHRAIKSAQLGQFASAGHLNDRAGAHEEKALVKDVSKCVRHRAIQRHLRADADAGDHVANLTDDVVSQQPSGIVFQHRIDDAVESHDGSHPDEQFSAGKNSNQHVDCRFGGERRHEYGAGDRSFGIRIRQPCMERWNRCVDEDANQHQVESEAAVLWDRADSDRFGCKIMQDDPTEQADAAEHVHQNITVSSGDGSFDAPGKDQVDRGKRHELPKDKQGKEIAGKSDADGAGNIEKSGCMLATVLNMQGINDADEGHDTEHPAKHDAELVHRPKDELDAEKVVRPVLAWRHEVNGSDPEQRNEHDKCLLHLATQEGEGERAEN